MKTSFVQVLLCRNVAQTLDLSENGCNNFCRLVTRAKLVRLLTRFEARAAAQFREPITRLDNALYESDKEESHNRLERLVIVTSSERLEGRR